MRAAVRRFAEAMERKLKTNDHKRSWKDCDEQYLSMRLTQERHELRRACQCGDAATILDEAADVANFAMMIADNAARRQRRAGRSRGG